MLLSKKFEILGEKRDNNDKQNLVPLGAKE
jgi:hypothetical protein